MSDDENRTDAETDPTPRPATGRVDEDAPPALIEPVPVVPVVGEPVPYVPPADEYSSDDYSAADYSAGDGPASGTREDVAYAEPAYVETVYAEPAAEPASADDAVSDEPEAATAVAPGPVAASASQQVVYVSAPIPPKKKGNRVFGVLMAVLATLGYAAVFALAVMAVIAAQRRTVTFSFVTQQSFLVPVVAFLIGFVLLVLITNRASWWSYIVGSLFVGAFVYLGTIAAILLLSGVVADTPTEAMARFSAALINPLVIIAGLLARELTMWTGLGIAARGRRVKARNAEARAEFDRGVERDRAGHASTSAS